MSGNSTTVTKSVGSVAKVILLAANSARREWLIRNSNAIEIQLFFNDSLVVGVSYATNILCEPNALQGFNGKIEGLMASGGAVNIQVTEVL